MGDTLRVTKRNAYIHLRHKALFPSLQHVKSAACMGMPRLKKKKKCVCVTGAKPTLLSSKECSVTERKWVDMKKSCLGFLLEADTFYIDKEGKPRT